MAATAVDVKARSREVTMGVEHAAARSMFRGTGLSEEDLRKPIIGIANTWTDVTPCQLNLRDLAEKVKEGIRAAGGTPIEFGTICVTDGIAMGTEGMRASLVSREVIADSIELVVTGHRLDGIVTLDRVRQDAAGRPDGPSTAEHPRRLRVRRQHHARYLPGQEGHDPGLVRGARSSCQR